MSFGARLAMAFVGLVAAVALVFAAVGFVTAETGVTRQVDRFLEDRAEELIREDRDRPSRNDGDRNKRRDGASVGDDSVVQTLAPDGEPLRSTGIDLPVDDRDRELAASGNPNATRLRTIATDAGLFRMITAPLPDGGAVQVARELSETNSAIDLIRGQLAVAIPLVTVLAGLVGLVLARRITGPLRSLTATVDTVAATGDLSVPVEVSGRDEIGRLASGFDNLLQSLSRSRTQQHQLVQDAAHELRTPLTSVKANVDLLAAAPDLEPDARLDTLRSVQGELRQLTRLVDEIVEVATDRHQPQQLTAIDLAQVATEAIGLFQVRRPERAIQSDLTPVRVLGDHDSLVRAAGNLLSNADKYSPADAPISVTVGPDRRLAVADRGPGIPPAERDRVFDRFYRSDEARAQPGSGLGLAIVATIVEAHNGQVAIDDHPGGGAVVSFTLPS